MYHYRESRSSLEVEHSLGKGEVEGPIPSYGTSLSSYPDIENVIFKRYVLRDWPTR